jgi:hypothetical protein
LYLLRRHAINLPEVTSPSITKQVTICRTTSARGRLSP